MNKPNERKNSIKLLGVLLDGNINWKDHIRAVKKKKIKNIGLLFHAKNFLNPTSLKRLHFVRIHPYINYANIAFASIRMT